MKIMQAFAVALANIAKSNLSEIPEAGTVIWSCRVGDSLRYFYWLEVRIKRDFSYRVTWHHSSGHLNEENAAHAFLLSAVAAALKSRRDYYQTEAEEHAGAVEWLHAEMASAV